MSAITGIGESATIVFSASTSFSRGTATRTRSEPASATLRIWSIVAARFAVSVLVIVWTTTGAPPPIGTSFTHIWRLLAIRCKGTGESPQEGNQQRHPASFGAKAAQRIYSSYSESISSAYFSTIGL